MGRGGLNDITVMLFTENLPFLLPTEVVCPFIYGYIDDVDEVYLNGHKVDHLVNSHHTMLLP
jgi:hypothetical protein